MMIYLPLNSLRKAALYHLTKKQQHKKSITIDRVDEAGNPALSFSNWPPETTPYFPGIAMVFSR
jgi:hypothetical protein